MKFSIIIPAHNEEGSLPRCVDAIMECLSAESIDFEIVLPPGGSAGALNVLAGQSLDPAPSGLLLASRVSAGNPIPAGTTGTVVINMPKVAAGYLRLEAVEP